MKKNWKLTEKQQQLVKKYGWRVLLSMSFILAVFVMPLLSQARYRSYLNSFAAVIAKEYYFSSNYLKEEPASYLLNGWNGSDMKLDDIQIRNYDNTLLTNQTGQDLNYIMNWTVRTFSAANVDITAEYPFILDIVAKTTTSEGDGTGSDSDTEDGSGAEDGSGSGTETTEQRTPTITQTSTVVDGEEMPAGNTGTITCTIVGDGNSKRDIFEVYLKRGYTEDKVLDNGCYVTIEYVATNNSGDTDTEDTGRNQYSRTISAKLRYNVSILENFIRVFDVTLQDDDLLVTSIATNTIPGAGAAQKVYLWWDKEKLEVNQFNFQFNQLKLEGKYKDETHTMADGTVRSFGKLEISASSLSARRFEFERLTKDAYFDEANKLLHVSNGKSYTEATATDYLGYYLEDIQSNTTTGGADS